MRPPGLLRAIIADDEAGARMHLRGLLEDCGVRTVDECATGSGALAAARGLRADFLCLDVRMPGMDGLEVARRLDPCPPVVFTTGYGEYASAAFDLGAVDYLVKPFSPSRVEEAVRRVQARLALTAPAQVLPAAQASPGAHVRPAAQASPVPVPRVFLPAGDHRVAVAPESIRFVEARGGGTMVHTDEGVYRLRVQMSRIERLLGRCGFLRTHRAYLVNLGRVQALVPWSRHVHTLVLDDGKETHVPVAKSRLAALRSSVIWIRESGGGRGGPGAGGEGCNRGRREPGSGQGHRRGPGG